MGHTDSSLILEIWLSVEQPHTEVQVCGKRHPEQIWDLQPCGQFINLAEGEDHEKDQYPQRDQPDQCEAKVLEIEKDDAPEENKGQLEQEEQQTAGSGSGCRSQIDPRCADPHQGKENGCSVLFRRTVLISLHCITTMLY